MWRLLEAELRQAVYAAKRAPHGRITDRQIMTLQTEIYREASKSEELSVLLETTVDSAR